MVALLHYDGIVTSELSEDLVRDYVSFDIIGVYNDSKFNMIPHERPPKERERDTALIKSVFGFPTSDAVEIHRDDMFSA